MGVDRDIEYFVFLLIVKWVLRKRDPFFFFLLFPMLLQYYWVFFLFFSWKCLVLVGTVCSVLFEANGSASSHSASFTLSPSTAQAVGPVSLWPFGCLCHPSTVTDIILFWCMAKEEQSRRQQSSWCFIMIGSCSAICRILTPKKTLGHPYALHCISWTSSGLHIVWFTLSFAFTTSRVGEIWGHKHNEWFSDSSLVPFGLRNRRVCALVFFLFLFDGEQGSENLKRVESVFRSPSSLS